MPKVQYRITSALSRFVSEKRIESRLTLEDFCAETGSGTDCGRTLRDILRGTRSDGRPVLLWSSTIDKIATRLGVSERGEIEAMCQLLVDGKTLPRKRSPLKSAVKALELVEAPARPIRREISSSQRPIGKAIPRNVIRIAIIANGTALYSEEAYRGFVTKLESLLAHSRYSPYFDCLRFDVASHGSVDIVNFLDAAFGDEPPNYIVAIGTQPTLAAIDVARQRQLPLIFIGVTDPVRTGVVPSLNGFADRGDVAGVTFGLNTEIRMRFLAGVFQGRKIGFIYSRSHPQDLIVLEDIARLCSQGKFLASQFPCIETDATELSPDEEQLADAFFGYFHLTLHFNSFSRTIRKPVVGISLGDVRRNAVVAIGHESAYLGEVAATDIVFPHLTDEKPLAMIPVIDPHATRYAINMRQVRGLGLTISDEALGMAELFE